MELYFAPLACSMAARVCLYEAGATSITFLEVDTKLGRVRADGRRFRDVNPLGLVPALRTDEGAVITENAAVLQYIGRRFPSAGLVPDDDVGQTRVQQWLCFIGTELHKAVFAPLLDAAAPDAVKAYALGKSTGPLDVLSTHLEMREFLLDHFTVADAYLAAVLGWCPATPIELTNWPVLKRYLDRLRARPSVARAWSEERKQYAAEKALQAANTS